MKLSIVRSLALLALSASLCSLVVAAPPTAGAKPGAGGPGGRMGGPGGGGRRGGGMMMRMMKDLNLTPAQQAKMKTLMDQRRAVRESTTLTDDQKRAKMTAMNPKIDAILTPAQRKKRATMMAEMRKRFQGGGGRMGGGPGGAPRARA